MSLESDNSIVFKDEELTIFKEDGEEFNFKDIAKINKNNLLSGEAKSILLKVQETNNEERKIKKEIKEAEVNLESKIKDKIESLTIKEALLLLEDKWIKPMYEDILSFSKRVKEELLEKVSYLNDKYETTLSDINNKIQECNSLLLTSLDNIVSKEEDVSGLDELKKLLGGK